MNNTSITHEMTNEQYDRMVQGIKALDAELGFAVNLTAEQRRKLNKMGDKSFAFVDKAKNYSTDRPDLVPPCSDMADFKKGYDLASKLRNLLEIAEPVMQKIRDSYYVAGANTFSEARKYYGYVKAAAGAGTPGSTAISNDLKKRYIRGKSSDKGTAPMGKVSDKVAAPIPTSQE